MMNVKKIMILNSYQLKNQFRDLALDQRLSLVFEIFDIFIQPIVFSFLLFIINPNSWMIFLALILVFVYNLFTNIDLTYRFLKNIHRERSFRILGYTKAEYRIGSDLAISSPKIFSNIFYAVVLTGIVFLYYRPIFLPSLGLLVFLIFLLPVVYFIRLKLIKDSLISERLLFLFNRIVNYPVFTILVLVLNMRNLQFSTSLFVVFFLLAILLFFVFILARLSVAKVYKNKEQDIFGELSIAIWESNYPLTSQFFVVGIILGLAIYIVYVVSSNHYVETSQDFGKINGLLYMLIPSSVLYNIQTSLSCYYSYDIEGKRMLDLKNTGNFIQYKIKNKLGLAYLLSIVPYAVFLISFFILYDGESALIYLIAYLLCCATHPLFFLLGSMYFPNYKRSRNNINQKMSSPALAVGTLLSTVTNLASTYYVWFTKSVWSMELLLAAAVNALLVIISLRLIRNRYLA